LAEPSLRNELLRSWKDFIAHLYHLMRQENHSL
jgi:hypothetical protein